MRSGKHYKDFEELADGLIIYRNSQTAKLTYYVRILKGIGRGGYIVRSLKTTDRQLAKRKAFLLYEEIRQAEYYGFGSNLESITQLSQIFINSRPNLSDSRKNYIQRITNRYFKEYFGSTSIEEISRTKWKVDGYVGWRNTYWERWEENEENTRLRSSHLRQLKKGTYRSSPDSVRPATNYSKKPARSTITQEISLFNLLMSFAAKRKMISGDARMEYSEAPPEDYRYQAVETFETSEIRKIRDFLAEEWTTDREPVLDDDGNQCFDEHGIPMWHRFMSRTPEYGRCRMNLRALVVLMLNLGARAQECLDLLWEDIEIQDGTTDTGDSIQYLSFRIREKKSRRQSKMMRTSYAPIHTLRVLSPLRAFNSPFNSPKDRVFCKLDGSRYGLLSRRFQQLLKRLDLYEDRNGVRRTLTHLRSYYAKDKLKTHPLHLVSANMGNSPATLFQYYARLASDDDAYSLLGHLKTNNSLVMTGSTEI